MNIDFTITYTAFVSAAFGGALVAGYLAWRKNETARRLRRMVADAQALADDGSAAVEEAKRLAEEAKLRDNVRTAIGKW